MAQESRRPCNRDLMPSRSHLNAYMVIIVSTATKY